MTSGASMEPSQAYKLVDIALLGLRYDSPTYKFNNPQPFVGKEFGRLPQLLFDFLSKEQTSTFGEDIDYVVERLLRMRRCHQVGSAVSVHWDSLKSAIDRIKYTQEGMYKQVKERNTIGGKWTE
jgi:hypothetical protein